MWRFPAIPMCFTELSLKIEITALRLKKKEMEGAISRRIRNLPERQRSVLLC